MAAYKTGAFMRSKYYTPFWKTPLKWIPRSKPGASKSRPRWAAHTRIGNVWEYPTPPGFSGPKSNIQIARKRARILANKLLHFVSLTDSFIRLGAKLLKLQSLM